MMRNNKKGFTLAELLIVVAIIAVLVAISIPVFTSQLEKSREATDKANIRAAIAEVNAVVLSGEYEGTEQIDEIENGVYSENSGYIGKRVFLSQEQDGWQSETPDFGKHVHINNDPLARGFCTVEYYFVGMGENFPKDMFTIDYQP